MGNKVEINKCIYCGAIENLADEHIVPFGISGATVLGNASCQTCSKVTSSLELHVQRVFLARVRAALDTKTRRPKERKYDFPVTLRKEDGSSQTVQMHASQHPAIVVFPVFPVPGFLRETHVTSENGIKLIGTIAVQMGGKSMEAFQEELKTKNIASFDLTTDLKPAIFARFIAKVALGAAVLEFGIECFEEVFVIPAIFGKEDKLGHWIGTITRGEGTLGTEGAHLTNISVARSENPIRNRAILVRVKFFAVFETPEYAVIVGRLKKNCLPKPNL